MTNNKTELIKKIFKNDKTRRDFYLEKYKSFNEKPILKQHFIKILNYKINTEYTKKHPEYKLLLKEAIKTTWSD